MLFILEVVPTVDIWFWRDTCVILGPVKRNTSSVLDIRGVAGIRVKFGARTMEGGSNEA